MANPLSDLNAFITDINDQVADIDSDAVQDQDAANEANSAQVGTQETTQAADHDAGHRDRHQQRDR